ncbi:MAG: Coenzyme F420 hydrogenase/dehydrogenase, beta subunit C-terminal domain [Candidatus Bathyarchaeota archaeon]|nr:Coenzyme F420 hydrogenase/dehydrogenase, beta subunit C-terminal domain [Candidatus Bathyarchaeota archaeon]
MPSKQENTEEKKEAAQKPIEDEDLGVYWDLFSAKTAIDGQDGGVVSALLVKGLREGLFDSAIVVRRVEGYCAEAVVAQTAEEVLAAKGTKYLRVDVTKKLREIISQGKNRIAIVCTPCQAGTTRKIQQTTDCEVTIIGLFCYECFKHDKLKEALQARLGVDLDSVGKTQVRQGKFTAQVEDREVSCKVRDLHGASEVACGFCDDFTSRLADVSVGSVGSKPGYSTVIVRSKFGEQLVHGLEADIAPADKQEIAKISKFKKQRAQNSLLTTRKPDLAQLSE